MTDAEALAETLPPGLEPQSDTWAYIAMPGQVANSLAHLTTLVEEGKIHIEERGGQMVLATAHVDPANVAMGDIKLRLDSDLGIYQSDTPAQFTTGLRFDWLRQRLLWARVGRGDLETGDDVHLLLDHGQKKVHSQVERAVVRTSSRGTIDPDAIRQEPDIPDLTLECHAPDVSHTQLYEAVQAINEVADHVRVTGEERDGTGDLILEGEGDITKEHVRLEGVADPTGPIANKSSLFSLDYLKDVARALHLAKMEKVSITWGAEFPVKVEFTHSEWGIEGTFMVAPRIQAD